MTLNRRLFLYFFSIFFLMLAIISFFQYQREKEFRTQQLDQQLTIYNYTINKFFEEKGASWETLEQYVRLFPDSSLRVTVIDTAGVVIFDSFVKKGTKLGNHLQRPEIQMALNSENGKAIRHSFSTGVNYYYLAHRFPRAFVRSALPYNVSLASMLKANTSFMYFMIVVLILAILALYLIARNFTQSIDRLRIFTQKAENEEILDTDIEFPNDELGEISKNIVHLYKLLLLTKDDVNKEREKLIKHLLISQEGLGIFSSEKKVRLKEMLAASRLGITSRLASPLRRESGCSLSRISTDNAASPCISPSTLRLGQVACRISHARRILRADAELELPKFECDSSATFGSIPKRRSSSAAMRAISATSSALGFSFT